MKATIQIYTDGHWKTAGTFSPTDSVLTRGITGGGNFEYDMAYVVDAVENAPHQRASLRYPVTFELFRGDRWPAFLQDIMPTSAGRRVWLQRLELQDHAAADWELLIRGAGNPPGNIRIAEAVIPPAGWHPGFTQEEIVMKNVDFIEYAESRGAMVAGATNVQGDAPKFLLVRDRNRRWHPDGALEDSDVLDCWLVKFPRGETEADLKVLRNEAAYLEVARRFRLRVGEPLQRRRNALFIPRFDRRTDGGKLDRIGFETLQAAAGITDEKKRGDHLRFCSVIRKYSTRPRLDILEYLRRDILNTALRNTGNHGRNTGFLKFRGGTVALSPLYDFAPMFLDPAGIPRSSRWPGELEPVAGRPVWGKIAEALVSGDEAKALRERLAEDALTVAALPDMMRECSVEDAVIERVAARCADIARDLQDAGA